MSDSRNDGDAAPPITVGFIGLGLMGQPMVRRLLSAGHTVHVWNRNQEKSQAMIKDGAVAENSIEDLVQRVTVLFTCVSDTSAVQDVMLGDNGVLPSLMARDKSALETIIDHSSIAPDATRTLAEQFAARGVAWIDAPVSGGVVGAESGSLAIMAGGDAEQIAKLKPLLSAFSRQVTHMGPVGSGQVAKICNQMIVGCNALVIAEMIALAKRAGIDAGRITEAFAGGFADSKPLQILAPRMASDTFEPVQWRVKTLQKDLNMALDCGRDCGSELPMSALALELMQAHAECKEGEQEGAAFYAEKDPSTLIRLYHEGESDVGNNEE